MEQRRSSIVRFADYRLDLKSGELWHGSQRVILPDQPFRILATLIHHHGELVGRDALRRELWADDTFVDFERGLNAAIKRLREMLGDSATAPRFIETIPRRGYRFIAPVVEEDELPAQPVVSSNLNNVVATMPAQRRTSRALGRLAAVLAAVLVAAGLASSYWLRTASQEISKSRLVRLTSTSGLNIDPALSPDGSLLAFSSDRAGTGNLDIWVQRVPGGDPIRLTTDAADDVEPSFSPDGASIVFARRETGGIYIVGAHGGDARLLAAAQRAHAPRFSPDGRSVAYWIGQTVWTNPPVLTLPAGVEASTVVHAVGALFVVPRDGGPPRALAADFISARYAVWSPDGGHILFLGERATRAGYAFDWYGIGPDGSNPTPTGALEVLQRSGVTGVPIPGAWTANGDVVFTTAHDDTANVWQLPMSSTTGRATGVPRRLTFGTAMERDPVISRDGRIAFASVVENVDVWRVPLDPASGATRGSLERVTDDVARDELLNVSADGRLMAFLSSRTLQNEIWLEDLRTNQLRQLTEVGARDGMVSPDASLVVAEVGMGGPNERLELYPSSGGLPSTLCTGCSVGGWSFDGSQMVIARGRRRLVMEIDTRNETEFAVRESWYLNKPRFTRDGRWVAFHVTNSPVLRQIYAVPATQMRPVPPHDWIPVVMDHSIQPSWAPDGSALYHFSDRDGYMCAWLQRVDAATKRPVGDPQAVLHLHQPTLRAGLRAMASNDVQGGYLYMTLTATTGNIWMFNPAAHE
jgi:Tol biopolymer transport system component/DNA-binding winged helix-turn-helix (wHTH) protein